MNLTVSKKSLSIVLKVALVGFLAYYLYRHTLGNKDAGEIYMQFRAQLRQSSWPYLFLAILLWPLNIFFEAVKWKVLLRKQIPITWREAITTIFSGHTMAAITPARLGEYVGRSVSVPIASRPVAISATFVSSMAQLLATLLIGCYAFFTFTQKQVLPKLYWVGASKWLVVGLVLLGTYLFFRTDLWQNIGQRIPFVHKWTFYNKVVDSLSFFSRNALVQVLLFSIVRLLVYSLQYAFVLRFFDVHVSWEFLLLGIWSIYFIHAFLPISPIIGWVLRGEIALLIWSVFNVNELIILSATYLIWALNILIPSLIGLIFVSRKDLFTS